MSKKDDKVLTLDELIAKKAQKEDSKTTFKDIYIKSLNGCLRFEKPINEDTLQCLTDMGQDENDIQKMYDAFITFEYNCCPIFKKKELQEAYGVKDFYGIVGKLLTIGEVLEVGKELLEMSGITDVDIKN